MKSETEEFCRVSFDEFLKGLCPAPSVLWHEVPQQDEPPDYYATINGTRFAVEVTTLMETVSVGAISLPHVAVWKSMQAFTDEVRETAEQGGFLDGTYIIGFMRPIEDFELARDQIRSALLGYIRRTQHVGMAPEETVFRRRGLQRCCIRKVHDLAVCVAMGGPTLFKWEGEAAVQICDLLEERLEDKLHKLRGIQSPRILLLHDRYLLADSAMVKDCIPRLPSLSHFHTVLIVGGAIGNFVLHTHNSDWL